LPVELHGLFRSRRDNQDGRHKRTLKRGEQIGLRRAQEAQALNARASPAQSFHQAGVFCCIFDKFQQTRKIHLRNR